MGREVRRLKTTSHTCSHTYARYIRAGLQQGPIPSTPTPWCSPASDHPHSSKVSRLPPFLKLLQAVLTLRTSGLSSFLEILGTVLIEPSNFPRLSSFFALLRTVLTPRTSPDCPYPLKFFGLSLLLELLRTVLVP